MKTILKIFRDDIRLLSRRFFASAVIVAISILPALYAWVNIYANGNPYANTGEIKIALASYDTGIDLEDGSHVNMAEEVFEEMKGSDKIGWQFPKTPTDAIAGVKSGKYYAAVIFQDNFTYNMYNFEQALVDDKAPLIYYENQKANAIAPKITQTAANTLQETIKTKYLETVFSYVFDETGELADELSEGDMTADVIKQLENLRDTLRSYDKSISSFTAESKSVKSGIVSTQKRLSATRVKTRKSAAQAQKDLATAKNSLDALKKSIAERKKQLEEQKKALEEAQGYQTLMKEYGFNKSYIYTWGLPIITLAIGAGVGFANKDEHMLINNEDWNVPSDIIITDACIVSIAILAVITIGAIIYSVILKAKQ